MAFSDVRSFDSPTGAVLALRHAPAAAPGKAVMLICHGLAEHAGRYRGFADLLAGRFYHVYAWDHRGHGLSRAADAEPGRFAVRDGARRVVEDGLAVAASARAGHPGLPVLLFGHSMGGMIALAAAEATPSAFDGLAVWNANLHPGLAGRAGMLLLRLERFLKGSDVPSLSAPKFTFDAWSRAVGTPRTRFDWLSRDRRAVDAYVADPLCGFQPSVSMWLDVLQLAQTAGRRGALSCLPKSLPVHLLGGGQDPATGNGQAVAWLARRMRQLGMTAIHSEIHNDMRHETINEPGGEDAVKAFIAWADGVVGRVGQQ